MVNNKNKSKMVRVPVVAYDEFMRKKAKMEQNLKNILGKPKKITLTKVIKVVAKQPVYLSDEELRQLSKKKKGGLCAVY